MKSTRKWWKMWLVVTSHWAYYYNNYINWQQNLGVFFQVSYGSSCMDNTNTKEVLYAFFEYSWFIYAAIMPCPATRKLLEILFKEIRSHEKKKWHCAYLPGVTSCHLQLSITGGEKLAKSMLTIWNINEIHVREKNSKVMTSQKWFFFPEIMGFIWQFGKTRYLKRFTRKILPL